MLERYKYIFNIALEAVFLNKFRSVLTALGIIFGVAAVITMMAIGNGAKKVILDQMKLVGVNNILIMPKSEKKSTSDKSAGDASSGSSSQSEDKNKDKYTPGLSLKDAEAIRQIIPTVSTISPEVIYETDILKDGIRTKAKCTGITPDFFRVFNLELQEGQMFNNEQLKDGKPVCIIGPVLKSKFFPAENAVGKDIKVGPIWLKVIGVLKKREVSQTSIDNLGISDYNNTIYAPIQTLLRRFKDRSVITSSSLHGSTMFSDGFSTMFVSGSDEMDKTSGQIDKIVVQVKESGQITPTVEVLKKMMLRRHAGVDDVEIRVPELLLKQEQRTKDIFNIVLGAIASISLLVGGIGIMNIMLASVMERIKEIGIRRAIGATRRDIIFQFLMEATLLSITGGMIGIILGLGLSYAVMKLTSILTIVSPLSVFISFGVSASVGIIFGYMPAKRAAAQDPVESLRHE
ncbi:MAG TPA: ABC transporter permease [Bacteroidales bacterium]|nr:ABC transporter permease [Bacteroidales bacterium]HPS62253.1 ABC transporter permease [Bacteroidales bacterium]